MTLKKAPFSQLSRKTAFSCHFYKIQHDRYVLPNGEEGNYFIVDTEGSAMVIPQTADGKFVMVKQFRYIQQSWELEFPCGGLNAGEEPGQAALREGKEEAGLLGGKLSLIGEFLPFNGISNEVCHVFHIDDVELGENQLEVDEDLTVELYTRAEIDTLIAAGSIRDGMTLAAWQLFSTRR